MSTTVAPLGLVEEAVDDGEGGGDVEHSMMILRFPVTPCAAGQPLNDCTLTMITCRGGQFWTGTSPILGDDKAVRWDDSPCCVRRHRRARALTPAGIHVP
jgi:hypothetical protein